MNRRLPPVGGRSAVSLPAHNGRRSFFRRNLAVPLGKGDFLTLIHSSAQLVDFGEWDLRHRQILAFRFVDEVNVPELKAGDWSGPHIVQILLEIIGAARHIEESQAAQLLSGRSGIARQRHFMDAGAIGQLRKVQIFFNTGQDKVAGPVDRTVAAGAGIGEADNPLDLRGVFLNEPQAHGNGPALRIAGKVAVKGHPVQFQKFIPSGVLHQTDDF